MSIALPNFIGIGAPKAGTTWLFKCLQDHPDVFMAIVKETNFFDYATIAGRLPEYEAHFVDSAGYAAVGELSTRYLASCRAPARIKSHIPNVRLFVVVRNPIEQVYSHYWHLLGQNFHQWGRNNMPASFEAALESYTDKLLRPALYAEHLQFWLRHFEPSQLLLVFYDDIRSQPQQVLRTMYTFLGVDPCFTPPSIEQHDISVRRGMSPRSPLQARIYAVLYDQLSRHVYQHSKRLMGARAAVRLKEVLRVREIMAHLFLTESYPEMRAETRTFLRDYFAADIDRLSHLSGCDLSAWR